MSDQRNLFGCSDNLQFPHTPDSVHYERSTIKKRKKTHSVHYYERCTVVLIPSRIEYIDAGIDLWYNQADFCIAMTQVQEEMDALSRDSPVKNDALLYTSYIKKMLQQF
jgi:hypothetical protein